MKTNINLNSISDGKIYDIDDMVNADSGGCKNCSACCHAVGEMVQLNPFDVYEIISALNLSFDALLINNFELNMNNKIILPHLKMIGDSERCSFLNVENRCEIHLHRPNICRLFPLGRLYKNDDFKYFLQTSACVKPNLTKIKVTEWIGIQNYIEHKAFILSWHRLIKAFTFRIKFIYDDQELIEANAYLLNTFYRMTLKEGETFYSAFYDRLPEAKNVLGII